METLSTRGQYNLTQVIAKIPKSILEPSPKVNTIDLSMAENHLIREEISEMVQGSIAEDFRFEHLDWPKGFRGDAELLKHLASMVNGHFGPNFEVEPQHLTVTPGAAASLDALLYSICNAGDGVLVPTPYWSGYDAFFQSHSGVIPVAVDVLDLEASFGPALIDALEVALEAASHPIRGLVLCNPHNPLGRCYSLETLEQCAMFCQKHGIHLVSDEVFALSHFESPDVPQAPSFESALSLDTQRIGCDPAYIHVIWSMSKDLAVSGIRLGCVISRNKAVRETVALLTSVHVSSLSTIAAIGILGSSRLPSLLADNSRRLAEAYVMVTTFFKANHIEYFPSNAGIFVCAKLAPLARSPGDEIAAMHQYTQAGVQVAPGLAYHMIESQRGWMRVSFAIGREMLSEGLTRIEPVYRRLSMIKQDIQDEDLSIQLKSQPTESLILTAPVGSS